MAQQIGTKTVLIDGREYVVRVFAPESGERENQQAHATAGQDTRQYHDGGMERRAEQAFARRYLGLRDE